MDADLLAAAKETLAKAFGNYTHMAQRSEGAWKMGGVTFRDDVTLVRVLDDGAAGTDLQHFKKKLERELEQEMILIVSREVAIVGK